VSDPNSTPIPILAEFINSLGAAYNSTGDNQNYYFGGNIVNRFGYSNSNNFTYQLGKNVGIESQLNSFNPRGAQPGFNQGLAPGGQPSISQSVVNYFQSRINDIKAQVEQLKAKIRQ
jgi:ABC-type Fe3+-hydroxamate transport system substrate-binding protein